MVFVVRFFAILFFFFVIFGLQAARAFSIFGIQSNLFLICMTALLLSLPRTGAGFLFLCTFQVIFLLLIFFFFPFFLFEAGLFFLFVFFVFWTRRFSFGTLAADFFVSLFVLFLYFVFLGIRSFSYQFFTTSLLNFVLTFVVAFVFWFTLYGKKRISF